MQKFKLGTATAAFQCEGHLETDGRGKCIWDDVLLNDKSIAKYNPEPASDFYKSFDVDIKLAKEYGIEVFRLSIAWSRIFPTDASTVNKKAVEQYHKMFKAMIEKGIIPNVTLHHFDSPQWFVEKGDFLSKENIDDFLVFAEFCFKEFSEIKYWSTLNEINAYSGQKNISAALPPYFRLEYGHFFKQQYNMVLAHAKTVNLFKKLKIDGEIGVPCSVSPMAPLDENNPDDVLASDRANAVSNWSFVEPITTGGYSQETLKLINSVLKNYDFIFEPQEKDLKEIHQAAKNLDWVGINYYFTTFVTKADADFDFTINSTGEKGKSKFNVPWLWKTAIRPDLKYTHWDWAIYPEGLGHVVKWISEKFNCKLPIHITENGYGDLEDMTKTPFIKDYDRIQYIQDHFDVIQKLIDEGEKIEHYYLWSHMDMFSWTNGYNKRYGLFYVDFETQKRYEKLSAYWWLEKSKQDRLDEKVDLKELEKKLGK
ncbi:family 1 glycosylhydrolase [Spiroplasma clarkii]|uniref:6-phospho-beta-galactosidase n=1 Tax=Spiroplasma clarkii TaxID=2139 RepID=A0A2K8KFH6_9MOLU|nr:family 1 glycosylhydrolase [Spiroplasma clarkii]ATX70435.1 6-phospho-beta-galactosidase [Spiroplasma clarkii]